MTKCIATSSPVHLLSIILQGRLELGTNLAILLYVDADALALNRKSSLNSNINLSTSILAAAAGPKLIDMFESKLQRDVRSNFNVLKKSTSFLLVVSSQRFTVSLSSAIYP